MAGLALVPRSWPLLLLTSTACAPSSPPHGSATAPRTERSEMAEPAPEEATGDAVFLWSVPVTATAAARAVTAGRPSERDVGRSLRISFEHDGAPAAELRRRFPSLTSNEATPGVAGAEPTRSIIIAPLLEEPQPVREERRQATFVIDYDEPAVQTLLATIPDDARTPAKLEEFVARTLAENYGRGFDIASRVATLKKGDCTEHAVLLAALLRASGRSARVVVGIVVVLGPELALAAGHAWVEYADQGLWRRLDAALYRDSNGNWGDTDDAEPSSMNQALRIYLSTIVLEDEGPGYARELLQYAFDYAPRALTLDRLQP